MHKPGDLVFAKVEGWSPWPARIMCEVSSHLYKVFFYGTRQESLVKIDWIWSSQENLEAFSKKYGRKKDYCHALQEMKKTPDIFTVDDNDFCGHKCITCDQKRMNKKVGAIVESKSQMTESTDVGHLNDSVLASMKNVKVVIKKTIKCISEKEPKHETVQTSKKPKERITLDSRSSHVNLFKVNKKWIDKEPNGEQVTHKRNIAMMENRKSSGIKFNETKSKFNTKIDSNHSTKIHFEKTTPKISKIILKYRQNSKTLRLVESKKSVKENPKSKQKEKQIRNYHVETNVIKSDERYQENNHFDVEMNKMDVTLTQLKVDHNSNAEIESLSHNYARNKVLMETLTNKESKSIVYKEKKNTQSRKKESLNKNQQNTKHLKKLDMENNITQIWLTENPEEVEKEKMSVIDSDRDQIIDNIIYGDDDALDLDVSYDMFNMLDISQDKEDKSKEGQNGGTVEKGTKQVDLDKTNDSCVSGSWKTDSVYNQQKGPAPVSFPTPKLGFFTWENNKASRLRAGSK